MLLRFIGIVAGAIAAGIGSWLCFRTNQATSPTAEDLIVCIAGLAFIALFWIGGEIFIGPAAEMTENDSSQYPQEFPRDGGIPRF